MSITEYTRHSGQSCAARALAEPFAQYPLIPRHKGKCVHVRLAPVLRDWALLGDPIIREFIIPKG
eukprot:6278461-Pyramimonas_sp.AAC.1